jgi:hypothetical protein
MGLIDRGDNFKLVMILGEWAYRANHIPGSLHLDTRQRGRFQDARG